MHEPRDNLTRFRWHTGATLRRIEPDESCPRLYRDIGPEAMVRFLAGRLRRLAGPLAPILYTRTASYREPYVDHEPVGRLVFLNPHELRPWFSGVSDVYVAPVECNVATLTVGFLPPEIESARAERLLEGIRTTSELREVLGGRRYDEVIVETAQRLQGMLRELAETEIRAEPLRRRLQSRAAAEVDTARAWLVDHHLSESDLCSAWHHLPRERRNRLREALGLSASCGGPR